MSGWRGVLGGALVLIALQTLVQPAAANRVGGLIGLSTRLVQRFMDPTRPAIPDRSKPHEQFDFFSSLGDAVKGIGGSVASGAAGTVLPVFGIPTPGRAAG